MKLLPVDTTKYVQYMNRYHIGSLMAKIICSMNLNDDEIVSFFSVVKNETVNEIYQNIAAKLYEIKSLGEKVFIYGDYDCDGICSTSILVSILNKLNIKNGYYIPNRFIEGYGLNIERLKQAYEKGYRVLICVDNGVSSLEEIKWAKQNDMFVIVIDHHEIIMDVECDILLHPTFLKKDYQYLCATGLVYYLAKYMKLLENKEKCLALIGTIADMMDLKGVNIPIVLEGLDIINNERFKPISFLCNDLNYPINEDDIGYKICPKINAIGRLADIANPNHLVKFLLCEDERELIQYSFAINKVNDTRKKMTNEQYGLIERNIDLSKDFLIYDSTSIHHGLCGLLASKLSNKYNKPSLIFSNDNELLKGSGRGVGEFDLFSFLLPVENLFEAFGGHKSACGITIKNSNFEELKKYIENNYHYQNEEVINYLPIVLEDLTISNINEVNKYRPYGQKRKLPLFGLTNDHVVEYRFLKSDTQLKWKLEENNTRIECLCWQADNGYDYYLDRKILFLGQLKENNFLNNKTYNLVCEQIIEL